MAASTSTRLTSWSQSGAKVIEPALEPAPVATAVARAEPGPEVDNRPVLNPTGKPITMGVPLKDGKHTLGEVNIVIKPDNTVWVSKAALSEKLNPLLDLKTKAKLQSVRENAGQISVADVVAAGFGLRFDPGLLELIFEPTAEQRPVGEVSVTSYNQQTSQPRQTVKPSAVSGFLNLFGGVDHRWGGHGVEEQTSLRFDADAVLRLWDVVVENEFGFDGTVDPGRCPAEAQCAITHREGMKRRASRVIYDMPSANLRFQVGDTTTLASGNQASADLLGVRIDHSPRVFSPRTSFSPTGRSSFRIEKQSEIEVVINGAVVQRLSLRPGQYNLTDLPLQAGANDVELVITDETGGKRRLSFTSFSDTHLLPKGKAEWSASAGLPSYLRDNEREYRKDDWIASLFARYGVGDKLTGELNFQSDAQVQLAGAALYTALPVGFLGLQGAVSRSETGIGYAATANYDLTNIKGLSYGWTGLREALRLSAEYRSDDFRTPGEFQATASGILLPQYAYSWRFSGAYTMPLSQTVSASVSGRYQIGNENAFKISPLTVSKDRYSADLTLSAPVTDWLSGSVSVGYGNDSMLRDASLPAADEAAFRVGVRFVVRPDDTSRVTGRYDSLYNDAHLTASMSSQKGYERWDASADVHRFGASENTVAGSSLGYAGNRGEARIVHSSGTRALDTDPTQLDHRTSLRVGTAIAFAGGKVAVGQPIRAGGFAIVSPHESIAGKPLTVGSKEDPRAVGDGLGPALVGQLPNYAHVNLPVDVDDLPVGYSLGKGSFDVAAPYRAGFALEVGSASSVSAYGTLLNAKGEPVALLSGTAKSKVSNREEIAIFTNAAGRFGAEGLAPGQWIIEIATEVEPLRFALDVPKGTKGLFKAGALTPVAGPQEKKS